MTADRDNLAAIARQCAAVLLQAMGDEQRGIDYLVVRTGLTERKVRLFIFRCALGNPPRDAMDTWAACMAALGYVPRVEAAKRSDPHGE